MKNILMKIALISFVILGNPAWAQSASETCKKMIAEDRAGGMDQNRCECTYAVAEDVLDENIQVLLFDSWHNGTNNMVKLEAMPNKNKVLRQMQKMQSTAVKKC